MKAKSKAPSSSNLPAGLSQPAQRALAGAGISKLTHLTKFTETQVKHLHGIGPNALTKLKSALTSQGLSFSAEKKA